MSSFNTFLLVLPKRLSKILLYLLATWERCLMLKLFNLGDLDLSMDLLGDFSVNLTGDPLGDLSGEPS